MKYCSRCLYPQDHPLNLIIDEQGICSGCRVHEEKDNLDWSKRFIKLKKIVAPYKKNNRSIYNCIVPVSGARDSYFIVHVVKKLLGMNPLLVTYNKLYNTEVGIRNLSYLKTLFGCPLLTLTPNPKTVKKINLVTMKKMGSMYWHCIAGQTVFPVQTAYNFKVPLIIWGAHQGIDQVGMFSHTDEVEMTRKYRKEHDLMGFEAEDLVDKNQLTYKDLQNYLYPHDKQIEAVGVRGIYLNNYIRWDSKAQHELMIKLYAYETEVQQRTFDTYNDVDCYHYSGVHDYIKLMKCGYGKVTDHASREIRLKRLTRSQGIALITKYFNYKCKDKSLFCRFMNITEKEFDQILNKHISKKFWHKKDNVWKIKNFVGNYNTGEIYTNNALKVSGNCKFIKDSSRGKNRYKKNYITYGRGWID